MLSSITKKWEIESTFAPLVVLVIYANIHFGGLMLSSSIFQTSSIMAWQGQEDVEPFKMSRTSLASTRLFIFILVIQDHIESIGKANTIKRGWGIVDEVVAQSAQWYCSKTLTHFPKTHLSKTLLHHFSPTENIYPGLTKMIISLR